MSQPMQLDAPPAQSGRSSSPLVFPSSSALLSDPAPGQPQSALFNVPSSAASAPRGQLQSVRGSSPLFFPASDGSPTPRKARRGDIHSRVPPSTPLVRASPLARLPPASIASLAPSSHASGAPTLSAHAPTSDMDGNEPVVVVWGTMVTLQASMTAFRRFLRDFKVKYRHALDHARVAAVGGRADGVETAHAAEQPELQLYEHYLRRMRLSGQTNLNLDVLDLLAYPPTKNLYRQLLSYPQELIPVLDQALKDEVIALAEEDSLTAVGAGETKEMEEEIQRMEGGAYKVRPFGGERQVNMRELNPQDIDKIVCIKGLVIRATPIIPDMKLAFFRCLACSHTLTVEIDRGQIAEPDKCPREVCGLQGSMSLIHNRCEFADRQVVRLQETPDAVPDGQTPHTVSLCLYDELVDTVKPGDRISLTGIFRSVPVRLNPRQRVIKALFKTYLDVVHIKKTDKKRMGMDQSLRTGEARRGVVGVGGEEGMEEEAIELDFAVGEERARTSRAEYEQKLVELSRREDIYDYLARSLAPSIWEMDDIKKGILLQLFGGTNKTIAKGGGGGGPRYRGDINVLLVGDPGTSKSQILQYVHKIAPRGVYTSGKGSSAVGLTAYVTRDPDSKQLVLESGALVLSDGGVCCIDEFDKMSDATRSVLHEVMEQQTVSIAKAGIITTLNARTSILAAANPVGSKYNLAWPITRNIDLPPTLISRFDLLYLVLDKIDEGNDRRLARHLVGLYLEDRPDTGGTDILPIEMLSSYISYAKTQKNPVLTEEASQALVKAYVEMRNVGAGNGGSERRITATTRQLESMIRLSEAHARMRFSDLVELEDVLEGNRLIRSALKESATDPLTGLIDLDLLTTGQGQQSRKLRVDLSRELLSLLESRDAQGRGLRWNDVVKMLEGQSSLGIEKEEFAEVVKSLETQGAVKVVGDREKRTIRRVVG